MPVKLADTLKPMADFPAAMAEDINIVQANNTQKSLQKMYEDGDLGGGGGLIDDTTQSSDTTYSSYKIEEKVAGMINDTATGSETTTYSAKKINSEISSLITADEEIQDTVGDITSLSTTDKSSVVAAINETNVNLGEKADKAALANYDTKGNQSITLKTDANLCIPEENTESINYVYYGSANLPTKNSSYFIRTQRSTSYIVQFASDVQNELTKTEPDYTRKAKLIDGTWIFSPWQELATKDPSNNKNYNIALNTNTPNRYRILTWESIDKGGATVKIDFASRWGNIGLGSGSMIATFNTTVSPSIWSLGSNDTGFAYFEISYAKGSTTTCYLDLVTVRNGSNFQLAGTMDVSILEAYKSTVTFNNLEVQTNEFTPIDNTGNYIIKKNELNATMDKVGFKKAKTGFIINGSSVNYIPSSQAVRIRGYYYGGLAFDAVAVYGLFGSNYHVNYEKEPWTASVTVTVAQGSGITVKQTGADSVQVVFEEIDLA